ncbi:MAG: glycosyltransferase [Flavobacteriales bacterium]|jgi:glycosyltransferase involved in cell wall biosynthesis|nr:glycosyltransferase [Flavobacteriales bacterium]
MNKKVLFLYTELAGYTINCMKKAMEKHEGVSISVIRWPIANEAPFQFDFGKIKQYLRSDFTNESMLHLIKEEQIDLVVCSGWIDKDYVKVCRAIKNKIPTVLLIDNQWNGSLKQQIAKLLSSFLIQRNFTHAWVPGEKQKKFTINLGFPSEAIQKYLYVADTTLFKKYYDEFKLLKEKKFPKRFLYVGRYVKHKGIYDLWNAFEQLHQETENDWELWCVGTGEEFENRKIHPKIKHFGFLQPSEFSEVIMNSGVYVLPSHFEPWGVSVQEFGAAGYPMLLSSAVGSKESFLVENKNGYSFCSKDKNSLLSAMKKMIELSESELIKMQIESIQLSLSVTTDEWIKSLMSFKL